MVTTVNITVVKLSNLISQLTTKEPDSIHLNNIILSTLDRSNEKKVIQEKTEEINIKEVVK